MILSNKRITKVLIRLCRCTDWSASVLFANPKDRFSHAAAHLIQLLYFILYQTRVLVTHGIRWLPYVDRIIAMDQGVVAEIGSYEELMNHDGAFAKFMKTYLNEQHSDDSDSDNEC